MERLTWEEAKDYLIQYNRKNGITSQQDCNKFCEMVVVITEDTFPQTYTLTERSYVFTNFDKAFLPNMNGYSIIGNCLDGVDCGVRIDYYIEKLNWKVDYCYIKRED